ncbi:MAG: DUF5103 domain-containing protein [Bacteroidia bacterium]|nr:DUF5103 domain-containing protein [Bacteroidia bacterium]MCC6767406.1 DUF5103 domain-containing protein [Bacteroidia bacterium]
MKPWNLIQYFIVLLAFLARNTKAEIWKDSVYRSSIHTVMLQIKGAEGTFPIIELGSGDQFYLQFDDLDTEQKQLYYTIEHCNADWSSSNTMFSYYLQGLQQDLIQDFRYSFNTRKQYLHYDLVFPNDQMRIILSGNYILKVFEDGDRDNLVLTRRFMIYQNQVKISAKVKRPSVIDLRDTHQEVDALVQLEQYRAINPAQSMKLVIMQNFRWDNPIQLKPFGINQSQLNYDYDDGSNCFPGGNEYRAFDIRSLRQQSISVQRFDREGELVEVTLLADPIRRFREYQFLQEANGRYFIRNSDGGGEPEVDADYAWVRFRLPFEAPLKEGNLFLFGSFTDWQLKEAFRLEYDFNLRAYTGRFLLKQGIYNYSYAFGASKGSKPDESFIEGSFYNTENDYLLLMYGRAYTNNFDELIGISRVQTLRAP